MPVGQPLDLDAQRAHMFFAGAPPQPQAMDRGKVQRFVSRRTMVHDLGVEREARREAARGGGGVPRQDSSYCKTCFAAIAAALVALDLTRREGVIATGVLAAMQAGGSGAAASVNATAVAAEML